MVRGGVGLAPGGINFDAKLRRESTDVDDILHAHIGGMDALARGLKAAAQLVHPAGPLEAMRRARYASWQSPIGRRIDAGATSLEELERLALDAVEGDPLHAPRAASGRQEAAENILANTMY